jgi:chemotaxis protein MotB
MMAFFLVLWLLSTATPEQKIAIAGYFKDPIGFSESGTPYIIDLGGTPTLAPENTLNPEVKSQPQPDKVTVDAEQVEGMAEQVEKERLELLLQELQNKVEENPQLQKFKDQILFEITPDGLRIQIMDAENRPMFDSGSAREAVLRRHPAGHGRHHQSGAEQDQHQRPHRCQAVHRHRRFRQLGAFGQPCQRRAACAGGGQLSGSQVARVVGYASSALFDRKIRSTRSTAASTSSS